MKLVENFGAALTAAREEAGLTQRQLGERVKISHAQISRYEKGEAIPRPGSLRAIEQCLMTALRREERPMAGSRQDPQVNFRMPQDLKDSIERAASRSGRTVTAELIFRLRGSFQPAPLPSLDVAIQLKNSLQRYIDQSDE